MDSSLPQQPDFARVATSFRQVAQSFSSFSDAAEEAEKCANLLPVQQHSQIMDAFAALHASVNAINTRIDAISTRLDNDKEEIINRISVVQYNTLAQARNERVHRDADSLYPLRSLRNEAIPNFPRTLGDIQRMPVSRLNSIFSLLGLPSNGNAAEKRKLLEEACGILSRSSSNA